MNIRPHGPIVTALVEAWDNRKEIAQELGPYMPVTNFALSTLQTVLSEKNAINQNRSQEKSYKQQQESFEHQKKSHKESHVLAKKSYEHSVKAHKDSHALAQKSYKAQEEERSCLVRGGWMAGQILLQALVTMWTGK